MNLNLINLAPVFPLWLILLLFCLALAQAAIQCVVNWSKLGHERALVISSLRLIVIVVLVIFALNPSVVTRAEHRISPAVAIIVDTSESMGLSDANGKASRLNQAKALLSEGGSPLIRSVGHIRCVLCPFASRRE